MLTHKLVFLIARTMNMTGLAGFFIIPINRVQINEKWIINQRLFQLIMDTHGGFEWTESRCFEEKPRFRIRLKKKQLCEVTI